MSGCAWLVTEDIEDIVVLRGPDVDTTQKSNTP